MPSGATLASKSRVLGVGEVQVGCGRARSRARRSVAAAARRPRRHHPVQDAATSGHRDLSGRFQRVAGRPLRRAGTLRLRQVDLAEGGRRLSAADRRRDPLEGRADHQARPGPDHGVPGIRPAAAVEDGAGERRLSAQDDGNAQRQGRRTSARCTTSRRSISPSSRTAIRTRCPAA